MLRRRILVLFLCLFAAGFAFAGELAHAAMQTEPVCAQQDADAGACGSDGVATEACAVYCATSACVASALPAAQLTAPGMPPSARHATLGADCRSAPETAPPKALAS